LMRGNGYSLIEAGARGFADALTPLDPSAMTVEQLENGRLRYTYREGGRARIYEPERIFHLRGMGSDGIMGYSVITLARDSLGLTAATEEHGARQFGQGVRIGGVIESTENVGDDARKRFAEEWRQQYSGLGGAHRTPFLPRGMTFRGVTLSNEDAQFLETRTFQREQIAMEWFGVPIHRVGTSGTASFAAGIEQLNLGYIAFTLLGWIRRWESAIRRDLILAQDKFFAEFTMDHLLRGDAAARANYHRTAIVTGWETRNEVRALENLNPLPGLDEPLVPQNMSTLDEDGNVKPMSTGIDQPQVPARPGVPSAQSDPRGRVLAETIAGRLIRKEIAAIGKASNRLGEDREGFKAWATEFYRGHAQEVARDLSIDNGQARAYCGEQLTDLMVGGSLAPATWEVERTPRLARLALGDGG
ncbi:MAG TPA: phage portal protein, partial [Dehalococcoidia bacterium]|nr:phage portal protein [Dehalococcoidia bacterium]